MYYQVWCFCGIGVDSSRTISWRRSGIRNKYLLHSVLFILVDVVFSFLNLLGLYHDAIMAQAVEESKLLSYQFCKISVFNRFIRYWRDSSVFFKSCSLLLTLFRYTEVLMEMSVRKVWGDSTRWKWITFMELIKYFTGNKPLTDVLQSIK